MLLEATGFLVDNGQALVENGRWKVRGRNIARARWKRQENSSVDNPQRLGAGTQSFPPRQPQEEQVIMRANGASVQASLTTERNVPGPRVKGPHGVKPAECTDLLHGGRLGGAPGEVHTEKIILNSTSCAVTETGEGRTMTSERCHRLCTMGFPQDRRSPPKQEHSVT